MSGGSGTVFISGDSGGGGATNITDAQLKDATSNNVASAIATDSPYWDDSAKTVPSGCEAAFSGLTGDAPDAISLRRAYFFGMAHMNKGQDVTTVTDSVIDGYVDRHAAMASMITVTEHAFAPGNTLSVAGTSGGAPGGDDRVVYKLVVDQSKLNTLVGDASLTANTLLLAVHEKFMQYQMAADVINEASGLANGDISIQLLKDARLEFLDTFGGSTTANSCLGEFLTGESSKNNPSFSRVCDPDGYMDYLEGTGNFSGQARSADGSEYILAMLKGIKGTGANPASEDTHKPVYIDGHRMYIGFRRILNATTNPLNNVNVADNTTLIGVTHSRNAANTIGENAKRIAEGMTKVLALDYALCPNELRNGLLE